LWYFVLSILVNTYIITKSRICFVSQRNNVIKEVKNAPLLRMMILQIQENCGFLKGDLATTQYEEISQAPLI